MCSVAALEVLSPGPLTSIQDLGRFGFGRYGVAPSGAVDAYALRIANLLVRNDEGQAAIEVTLAGFSARILTDLTIAVTGADLQACVNRQSIGLWRAHFLKRGDILTFRGIRSGCRAYISPAGTIDVAPVMGSKSTNLSAAFGGFDGRPLQAGDILRLKKAAAPKLNETRTIDPEMIPVYPGHWKVRILLGPHDDHFQATVIRLFLNKPFHVNPQSNRFGIRLDGPLIFPKTGMTESIISEGVVAGAIQVPADGHPIIILGETVTGGYRKIASVISADLPLLGQIKPGDSIAFQAFSLESALRTLRKAEGKIQIFKDQVKLSRIKNDNTNNKPF